MDILLLSPPWIIEKGSFWKGLIANTPSLGLGYLAASLEKNGLSAEIYDASAEGKSLEDVRKKVLDNKGIDWIGISTTSYQYKMALNVAQIVRENSPGTRIIMGGVHPTLFPDEILSSAFVDFVVRNEGEITLPELMRGENPGRIPGISFKDNGRIVHNPDRPWIENLDDIPYPAYHLLPMGKSELTLGAAKRWPAVMLIGSRGCRFNCSFCTTAAMGSKFRYRSAENILGEIKLLTDKYGIREIHFQDDSFTLNRERVLKLCGLIKENKIDISWLCMANAVALDEEVLVHMKEAGCHQICMGIESGNEHILKDLNKPVRLDQVRKAVAMVKKAGIDARGSFMVGCPGETEETIKKTINFAKELDLDLISVTILTPLPGSRLYKWAKEMGYLMSDDWSEYTTVNSVMRLPTIEPEAVNRWHRKFYRKFYLRPSFLVKHILKIRSLEEAAMNLKAFAKILR
jgi:radical SAM superfamily enzyme YgiQ (UPF0313 family)